jgi:hypothetical protein
MKERYFLPLLQGACFLLISLLLQNCGGSTNLPIEEGEREQLEIEGQVSMIGANQEQKQKGNSLPTIMPELWQEIFSYLKFEDILAARAANSDCYRLITGFSKVGLVGVQNKPLYMIETSNWATRKVIDFREILLKRLPDKSIPSLTSHHLEKRSKSIIEICWCCLQGEVVSEKVNSVDIQSEELTLTTIPSFAFYHLMGKVKNLPEQFWPYLQGTNVHTLDLSENDIGIEGAIALAQHLQGTNVHTLDLWDNNMGSEGAIVLIQHLKRSKVHTLGLGRNKIGTKGAAGLAKHLQATKVHTLDLWDNSIGVEGVIALMQHLKETKVCTLGLSYNRPSAKRAKVLLKSLKMVKM